MKKLLIFILLLIPATSFASIPDFPMAFWGITTIDGQSAPAGAIIHVYDEVSEVGQVEVQEDGIYGFDNPTEQKLIIGEAAGRLHFTIETDVINGGLETQGSSVITYPDFSAGATIQKDLNFISEGEEEQEVETTSTGGSSSRGGGGGRKKVVEKSPVETVLGIASTTASITLSDEDLKIELQKQLIVLLKRLIELLIEQKSL